VKLDEDVPHIVDLIILEGKNVCPSVRPYVRPSTKSFFNL